MTQRPHIRIQEVILHLELGDEQLLRELREEGLFTLDEVDRAGADEFRLATLMVRELGVNPAGVQVALHLRRRLLALEARATAMMKIMKDEHDLNDTDEVDSSDT